jgi:hypothetical protein
MPVPYQSSPAVKQPILLSILMAPVQNLVKIFLSFFFFFLSSHIYIKCKGNFAKPISRYFNRAVVA